MENIENNSIVEVEIGIKGSGQLIKELKEANFSISLFEESIIESPTFMVPTREKVRLVKASVAGLGFKKGATYKDVCEKAKKFGLELCPAEVGPNFRLQYKDQPEGEYLFVAMEPISAYGLTPRIFEIYHSPGSSELDNKSRLELSTECCRSTSFCFPLKEFVFCRRTKV